MDWLRLCDLVGQASISDPAKCTGVNDLGNGRYEIRYEIPVTMDFLRDLGARPAWKPMVLTLTISVWDEK